MSNTPAVQLVAVLDHSVEKDSHAQLTKDKCCDGSAMAQEEQWQVLCASDSNFSAGFTHRKIRAQD